MPSILGIIRSRVLAQVQRRELPGIVDQPTVSFTFDDFPRSALLAGGSILKSRGLSGTYYAAMGLIDQMSSTGRQFSAEDLIALVQDGHELGSHTFSHLSCRTASFPDFQADMNRGRKAVEQIAGMQKAHHFSYPYGHVTLRAKPIIGGSVTSARGIVPGINEFPVDLNLLRANSLYSNSLDLERVDRLLEVNEERCGWLIFYTHDVAEQPSEFGCKPAEFESVVELARKRTPRILPVGQVVAGHGGNCAPERRVPVPGSN